MAYGSSSYGSSTYGGASGLLNPNATVDLSGLGAGGILTLNLIMNAPNVNSTSVVVGLAGLGVGGRLTLYLNKNNRKTFADVGELWRRVKRT